MDTSSHPDVIDVLIDQHEQIKALFDKVIQAGSADKQRLFDDLSALLRRHESGEQRVVHPVLRDSGGDGNEVALARIGEERAADDEVMALKALGVDHPDFDRRLAAFHRAVLDHAAREEDEEFSRLRETVTQERLGMMAGELLAVQTMS